MFQEAYLHFCMDEEIDNKHNRFSLDGGRKFPIPSKSTYYRIPSGEHTVVITSGTGDEWTIRTFVAPKQQVKVKLSLQDGDISDVMYKPSSVPFGTYLLAGKLPEK